MSCFIEIPRAPSFVRKDHTGRVSIGWIFYKISLKILCFEYNADVGLVSVASLSDVPERNPNL